MDLTSPRPPEAALEKGHLGTAGARGGPFGLQPIAWLGRGGGERGWAEQAWELGIYGAVWEAELAPAAERGTGGVGGGEERFPERK